mmetsp:Transcript_21347/g.33026  ORF Transcript_21347/g.33026 Transcript_21347/m.33026 type:complete len:235 (+) Transcript_21347:791-1495(+)|eukprot:CAMPEP_0170480658 /NCGR_PEP_ID=MMETSP0208-20121228/1417_1 /TAXON_ID=197538 /ORGANISM="Strombidium inclinatum, Strain S3" /LENGTH=234 /DNA_ID=CAMNT_0010753247 /DNA_START=786 /DNA_END=1490 /DNA_ORIENTATION=+
MGVQPADDAPLARSHTSFNHPASLTSEANLTDGGISNPVVIFSQCFDKVITQQLPSINPNIFRTELRTTEDPTRDTKEEEYKRAKRQSVFQKVDLTSVDLSLIPVYEKTTEQMEEILPLLRTNFLTKKLSEEEIEKIAGAMQPQIFNSGDTIIRYGDLGSLYYILAKGEVKVIVYQKETDPNDPDIDEKQVYDKHLREGSGFGELALLYNDKRSATIKAVTDCEAYVLDGKLFK